MARYEPSDEWLAGLLEGEGSFGFNYAGKPCVQVQMADHDVIERAARLMQGNTLGPYTRANRPHCQPIFHAKRVGKPAASVMRRVWPWMGERRSARIEEILNERPPASRTRGTEWLAGLLEGEGAFWRSKGGCNYVKLTMTDRDVVEAAAAMFPGRSTVRLIPAGQGARPSHWTDAWVVSPGGRYADSIMDMVLEYMGERRSTKIRCLRGENVSAS